MARIPLAEHVITYEALELLFGTLGLLGNDDTIIELRPEPMSRRLVFATTGEKYDGWRRSEGSPLHRFQEVITTNHNIFHDGTIPNAK